MAIARPHTNPRTQELVERIDARANMVHLSTRVGRRLVAPFERWMGRASLVGDTPFLDVAFTQVDLTAPPSSRFDFTPPKNATVTPLNSNQSGAKTPDGITPDSLDPQQLGTGWLAAVELHGISLDQLNAALSATGRAVGSGKGSAATSPEADGGSNQLISGGVNGYLSTLLGSGKTVTGAFGSGKLYSTNVLTVLITDDGRVFLGPVTAGVLEADAAKQGTK